MHALSDNLASIVASLNWSGATKEKKLKQSVHSLSEKFKHLYVFFPSRQLQSIKYAREEAENALN